MGLGKGARRTSPVTDRKPQLWEIWHFWHEGKKKNKYGIIVNTSAEKGLAHAFTISTSTIEEAQGIRRPGESQIASDGIPIEAPRMLPGETIIHPDETYNQNPGQPAIKHASYVNAGFLYPVKTKDLKGYMSLPRNRARRRVLEAAQEAKARGRPMPKRLLNRLRAALGRGEPEPAPKKHQLPSHQPGRHRHGPHGPSHRPKRDSGPSR